MPVKLKSNSPTRSPKIGRVKVPENKKEEVEEIRRLLMKRMKKKKLKEIHKFFDAGPSGANPRRDRNI